MDIVVACPGIDVAERFPAIEPVAVAGARDRLEPAGGVLARTQRVITDINLGLDAAGILPLIIVGDDAHRARCAGIGQRIGARATVQRIVACAAVDRVVTRAADQRVGIAIAGQHVVIVGTADALDPRERIVGCISTARQTGEQVDRHGGGRPGIIDDVVARPADDDIASGAGDKGIVASPAVELSARVGSVDIVVIGRTDDVLDVRQRVALRVAADTRARIGEGAVARADVDRHAAGGGRIICGVAAGAAVDDVGPAHASEHIVAVPAKQDVGIGVARQRIVKGRTRDVLDIVDQVALCVAVLVDVGRQVDGYARARPRIVDGIDAGAAVQRVGAGHAREGIVTRAAGKDVGVGITGQRVGIGRAGHPLDRDQHVARRVAAGDLCGGEVEVDGHATARGGVIGGIVARTAVEGICAALACEDIVAETAGEDVGVGIAGQRVGIDGAGDVLEPRQHVARGVAAGYLCGGEIEVDGHARARAGVADRVDPGAAVEHVRAAKALDRVVATLTLNGVGSAAAGQIVVVAVRPGDILDCDQRVALRPAARCAAGGQVHRHTGRRSAIADPVDPRAAVERVGTQIGIEPVVARASAQHTARRRGQQHVVVRRTGNVLDVDIAIALGIAADTGIAAHAHALRRLGRSGQVDHHPRRRRGIIRRVAAGAAIEHVRAAEPCKHVIARAALQHVGIGIARQRVGKGRTGDILKPRQRIAQRIAQRPGARRQADRDARGRTGIAHRIGARAAIEHVRARAAFDHVVARAARQVVDPGIAGQAVVIARTHDPFDRGQRVARGIAAAVGAAGKVDRDRAGRFRIVRGIGARTAVEHIRARARDERVVARTAGKAAAAGRGAKRIGIGRTGDVLDADIAIARSVAARAGARRQVDGDRRARPRIVGGIATGATVQRVRAAKPCERVIARTAGQHVVARIAGQHVGLGRTDQVLDIGQGVALRIATRAGARRQVDAHARARPGIARRVGAGAAVEHVRARAADQHVVARAADQRIGTAIARQNVCLRRTDHPLDARQRIAIRIAANARTSRKINTHASRRRRIIRRVKSRAAVEGICAALACEDIVAETAGEDVGVGIAGQRVGIDGAGDVLEPRQHVARGVAAGYLCGGEIEVDGHARARAGVADRVDPGAAVEHVRAAKALDRVVATLTLNGVGSAAAGQIVVVAVRPGDILDCDQRVALRPAARCAAGGQVHRHTGRRSAIADPVDPRAAVERVGTQIGIEPVVARASAQHTARRRGQQHVVVRRTGNVLDVDIAIALGIAADTGIAAHAHALRRLGRSGQVDHHPRRRRGIIRRVAAGAAIEHVRAAEPCKHVIARAALQHVGIGIARQRVGKGRTGDILKPRQRIAQRIAQRPGARRQADRDARGRTGIAHRIGARAAIEHVRARAAFDHVVARAARQVVDPGIAGQAVVIARTHDPFDRGQRVARGIAAAVGAAGKVDRDRAGRFRIVRGIGARTAVEHIRARARDERVVARTAGKAAAAGRGAKRIGIGRTGDVLDADIAIARSVAARAGARRQVDGDRRARPRIVGGIATGATVQRVRAAKPCERVIARTAGQHVVARIAGQHVGLGRTDQVLDIGQGVALRIATRAGARRQVDAHARARPGIARRVGAGAAVEHVRARAADQHVVARAADQRIGTAIARQNVCLRRTDHPLDARQRIAIRIAANARTSRKINTHASRRRRIIRRVKSRAAIEGICTQAADERVRIIAPAQHVVADIAGQRVGTRAALQRRSGRGRRQRIRIGRPDHALDARQGIARGVAAAGGPGLKVDRNARARCRIVGGVEPGAAGQHIGTRATF